MFAAESSAPVTSEIWRAPGFGTSGWFRHSVQPTSTAMPTPRAIVDAEEDDIVLTERVTGVPLAVIRTSYVERVGTKAGPIARWLLRHRRTKHFMRTLYALNSAWRLKRANFAGP